MPQDQSASHPVTASESVFEGRIWNIRRDTVDFMGEPIVREYMEHPGAVAILALNEQREVLLVRQYRHPVRQNLWEIPAGLTDLVGESKLNAAQRELLEESGWVATSWEELTTFYTSPGGSNEQITVYLAQDLSFRGRPDGAEGEERDLEPSWVPFHEALESVLKAEIKNPSTVIGILALAVWLGVSNAN